MTHVHEMTCTGTASTGLARFRRQRRRKSFDDPGFKTWNLLLPMQSNVLQTEGVPITAQGACLKLDLLRNRFRMSNGKSVDLQTFNVLDRLYNAWQCMISHD